MSKRKIEGYPSFVYDYLECNYKDDQRTDWVRNSELVLAGLGDFRVLVYHDRIILLQDIRTGVVADLRNIYPSLEEPSTVEYIVNYFLKTVNHTEVIPVYFDGHHPYYYWKEGE